MPCLDHGPEYFYEPEEDENEGDQVPTSLCMILPPPTQNVCFCVSTQEESVCIYFLITGWDLRDIQGLVTLQQQLSLC